MRLNILAFSVLAGLGAVQLAHAAEGMWVPQQLPEIAGPLKRAGLELDPQQLADLTGDPMGAVVALGGCTASFVSPQGLVATNHHCAYGAIQLNSTAENNLIKEGFSAAAHGDELSAGPNARIYVLDSITDVTAQAKSAIAAAGADPLKRTEALEALEKTLVAGCEADPGYSCTLYSFSGGNTYRLFKNMEIKDVRLAYAPPGSVGKFGGDVDNWMWPRHTGDFAFYRAYVGKDGKPAAFAADNVPYQPRHWLKLADQPLGEGDFVMVAGYPGRTDRYALASEFENTANWTYPAVAKAYKDQIALVEAAGRGDKDIAVKYAANMAGWNNTSKNFDSQLEGFERNGLVAHKRREEAAVLEWLRGQGDAGAPALAAHARLQALGEQARSTQQRDFTLGMFNRTGTLGTAVRLYRLAIEKAKPDAQREDGYQVRDLPAIEGGLKQMDRRYVASMDRELQQYWLQRYMELPADQRVPAFDAWLGGGDTAAADAALARLDGSRLGELDERMKWFGADRAAFEASTDPAIQYAVAVTPALLEIERQAKRKRGEELVARPLFLQAIADYKQSKGEFVYPDANLSLRITFGNVKGYTGLDGTVQPAFTALEGVVAKETGADPFDSPQALLDAVKAKRHGGLEDARLGSVPVNFLADLDITGGNSGSPVLDARGRLVGLAFDGIWEAVASNWVFDPVMTRMISVDQRYMRWIMQEVAPAPALLQELEAAAK
ncbi:S46 family peptidase [Stenotrophomonas mori]|uniref:Dipeptidyl-peptidase n=1 Tax=Stenotrophomonas mori TaxID=2871096 RepID=A0ABT0SHH3_9GAMM|nr:S46 family peptidase [Stenotrophomonas mori]MCL7714440.1 S46 family peptidase [Stenotrophomonas mori]